MTSGAVSLLTLNRGTEWRNDYSVGLSSCRTRITVLDYRSAEPGLQCWTIDCRTRITVLNSRPEEPGLQCWTIDLPNQDYSVGLSTAEPGLHCVGQSSI